MKKCQYIPNKCGKELMESLIREFQYPTAREIFFRAGINQKFIRDNKHLLELDEQGIPTFESLINTPYVQNVLLNNDEHLIRLNNQQKEVEDTIDNYYKQIENARTFNLKNTNKKRYIAAVHRTDNGKLKLIIKKFSPQNEQEYLTQLRQKELNTRIAEILKPLGITIDMLTDAEEQQGVIGVMGNDSADKIANDSISVIRIANNSSGAKSLSEEFAHLLTRAFADNSFVKRAIQHIKQNPQIISSVLGEKYTQYKKLYNNNIDLLAEETLGHILQENLLKNQSNEFIFNKTISSILEQFKPINANNIQNAILEVNKLMDDFAKSLLEGKFKLTKELVNLTDINKKLYAIKSTINNQNISNELEEVLKKILANEQKQRKTGAEKFRRDKHTQWIGSLKEHNEQEIQDIATILESQSITTSEVELFLKNYINDSIRQIESHIDYITKNPATTERSYLENLRDLQMLCKAYGENVITLTNYIIKNNPNDKSSLNTVLQTLNDLIRQAAAQYKIASKDAFKKILKDVLDIDKIKIVKNGKLEEVEVDEYLTDLRDITWTDMMIDAASSTSETLLQHFDEIVKRQRDKVKDKMIEHIKKIMQLRKEAYANNITDFSYFFETDEQGNKTGNYIDKIWYGKFEQKKALFFKNLEEKYKGVIEYDAKYHHKKEEIEAFYKSNFDYTIDENGKLTYIGLNEGKWTNPAYTKLSSKQKQILNSFLELKESLEKDEGMPAAIANRLRAIQLRKNTGDRIWGSNGNPITILKEVWQDVKTSFQSTVDYEDNPFENTETVIDFSGRAFHRVPILFTHRLENANELTEDVFKSLIAYSYSIENFIAMDNIVDMIEIARDVMNDSDTNIYKRGKKVEKTNSNLIKKLDYFINSQIYSIICKNDPEWKFFKVTVDKMKATNVILNVSSAMQLGFNWLANLANVLTGDAMIRIEAISGQYFNYKQLKSADKEYFKLVGSYLKHVADPYNQSELALLDDAIDFKGEMTNIIYKSQSSNAIRRILGKDLMYIGQTGGDHWLYNRVAIAMLKNNKIKVNGKEMTIWESRKIVTDNNGFKKMVFPENAVLVSTGEKFNIRQFSRKILAINQNLFGVYNKEDRNMAQGMVLGKLMLQYKKWIKPQLNKRFQLPYYDAVLDSMQEGYYITMFKYLKSCFKAGLNLESEWEKLDDESKFNVKRAITEMTQFACVCLLSLTLDKAFPDKKKRPYLLKLIDYMVKREVHELGFLALSPMAPNEMYKQIKEPIPSLSAMIKLQSAIITILTPDSYQAIIEQGKYEGYSEAEKAWISLPLAPSILYRQIKNIEDVNSNLYFYNRPH